MSQVMGAEAAAGGEDHDGRLLMAARRDLQSFGEFYDRNYGGVLAYFYRRTFCAQTSADLTSEVFAAALLGLRRYRPNRGSGTGWLYGIAANLHRQWLRRGAVADRARVKLRISTGTLTEDEYGRIEELVDAEGLSELVRAALSELSHGTRDAVLLRVGHDLSYEEVAERCGCTVAAARVRVSRGLSTLRDLMEVPA